ncbi:hypothetical protein ASAC_1350 [Acidilobus saccharovorans 345-15]|uniref:Uncharacterized protein n=1 Tax=Acidilobus saccharovorans (strain DSM 16705 / JCM 18335 / VKM B-2471 / 345-15) TaxID=666510 RepID=D9Q367_ACIS3|nr:hypothetical protein [Acidilobus saccharovorans]ADL19755.1 hypothetical protein ASAC_1350 [Acidilobus saccharovorans 345-15]
MAIRELGYATTAFAAALGLIAYFSLGYRPLAFSMIGVAIAGLSAIVIGDSPRPQPPQLRSMLSALGVNLEALLEEADARGKAIVMPPVGGRCAAFIPLSEDADPEAVARALRSAPQSLFPSPAGRRGVLAFLPSPLPLSSTDMESALREVVVERSEMAKAIRLEERGNVIVLEAVRPVMDDLPRLNRAGTLPLLLGATVVASLKGVPVAVADSYRTQDGWAVELRPLGAESGGQK